MTSDRNDENRLMDLQSEINSEELSERLKKRVHEKMAAGFYDDREVKSVTKWRVEATEGNEDKVSLLDTGSIAGGVPLSLHEKWDVTKPIDTHSPRGGVIGKVISLYKSIYRSFIQPTVNISMAQQAEFNSELLNYLAKHESVTEAFEKANEEYRKMWGKQAGLTQRMRRLEKDVDENIDRLEAVEGSIGSLAGRMEALAESLRDVDKQGIFIKRRVVKLLDEISKAAPEGAETAKIALAEREKLNSFDYVLFENLHRGSREEIKNKMRVYVDWFKGVDPVLDAGCGRGELIELLTEAGIKTSGVDLNEEMVNECKDRGIDATYGDALEHLRRLDDGSLGGITAIQFIEHLPIESIAEFFKLALEKLKPGGVIAAETVNPTCLTTFCGPFYLDMTHDKPIHPLAVQFLLERIGYSEVRIEYLNPYPDEMLLKRIPDGPVRYGVESQFVATYNSNVDILNNVLYSCTDYAVVARR